MITMAIVELCIPATPSSFMEAVNSRDPVTGFTHSFYRYPARFSPLFARAAIKTFTKPGDLVLDGFMGGGTSIVEARVLGRLAIGTDINDLSVFVSKVKTKVFSKTELAEILLWAEGLIDKLSLRNPPMRAFEWVKLGYYSGHLIVLTSSGGVLHMFSLKIFRHDMRLHLAFT
jgi:hypothetical protein